MEINKEMINKGVTVLVCTFNGASRLPKTIEHLSVQTATDKINWEIIVADNASTDNSAQIAREEWARYNLSTIDFTVINEARPGKIYALEQGFSIAKFEYTIICDDDNWLDPHYVENMYNILEGNPRIGAAGGQSTAVTDSGELPDWFKNYEEGYATGPQGPFTGDVTPRGHLWGAGLGTRTKLYQEMYHGFPSLLTGRLGNQLTAGEDAEYCQRLILKGYILYYDTNLFFQHYMPLNRLNMQYRANLFNGFTLSNKILHKYYLANKIKDKLAKSFFERIRLLVITPFRILLATSAEKRTKEKDIFLLSFPIIIRPNLIISKIRQFYTKNNY